jgi:hypothetical protein
LQVIKASCGVSFLIFALPDAALISPSKKVAEPFVAVSTPVESPSLWMWITTSQAHWTGWGAASASGKPIDPKTHNTRAHKRGRFIGTSFDSSEGKKPKRG